MHLTLASGFLMASMPAMAAEEGQEQQQATASPGRSQPIEKVERGFFLSLEVGPQVLIASDADADYGLGLGLSAHLGVDILPILTLSVGGGAVLASGSIESEGRGSPVPVDRLYFTPGLRLQLALFTTERHFVWVRAEGGLGLLGGNETELGPFFGGGAGWEYFTTLRHFSLGLQAGLTTFIEPDTAFSVYIYPTMKYTF